MKRAFLLIAGPALLVALGFAQTPAASINADQTNIKGCLGGSADNYTLVEDNTGRIFKVTTGSVDLKPHLSHDVTLIGHRASGANSPADDSFAVTELNMISEHCAASAAAPAATGATPAADATPPAETAIPPAAAASAPVETVPTPSETVTIPPVAAAAPAVTTSTVAEIAITPAAAPAAPVATVSTPAETVVTPAARPRKRSETPAAATTSHSVAPSSSSETVSTPAAAATPAATPAATSNTSSDPVDTPAPATTTPTTPTAPTAPTVNSGGWSLWLWIAFAVLVIVIGTMFPFFSRWRKQKSLERTGAPNLSFTREAGSDRSKTDKQGPRKAA